MALGSAGIATTGTGDPGAAMADLPEIPDRMHCSDESASADTGACFGMSGRMPQPVDREGAHRRLPNKEECTQECNRATTLSSAEEEI
jgi:hypothetical protein